MLPKYHAAMGHDVEVLASLESFDKDGKTCLLEHGGKYKNEYNIPVTRLEYKDSFGARKLRHYKGTYEELERVNRDIIFIHGCQFCDIKYNVKLLVFGSVVPEMKEQFDKLCGDNVIYIGWIKAPDSYKYFAACDFAVFPGRHSVFWEQVAAQAKPMIVKYWDGTTHVDIGGNVRFLYKDSVSEIKEEIEYVKDNFDFMKDAANAAAKNFLYSDVARRSIE